MNQEDLSSLRKQLESNSDVSLQRIIDLLGASIDPKTAAVEAARNALADAQSQLAVAREVAVGRPLLQPPGFLERWIALLDSRNPALDRFDKLQAAAREFQYGRQLLIGLAGSVRQDNHQTVLSIFVPAADIARNALYQHLLQLLPVLVNTDHADPTRQAAILEVQSGSIGDKEWVTLYVHPAQGSFEVIKADKFSEAIVFSGSSLKQALDYLGTNFPI